MKSPRLISLKISAATGGKNNILHLFTGFHARLGHLSHLMPINICNFAYDKNGNLVYVNTSRMMTDGHRDNSVGERKLIWDEENRLLAVDDNGFVSNY